MKFLPFSHGVPTLCPNRLENLGEVMSEYCHRYCSIKYWIMNWDKFYPLVLLDLIIKIKFGIH